MVRVIIPIRHGQGFHNLSNRAAHKQEWEEHRRLREYIEHDQYSCSLTEEGIAQARALRPYALALMDGFFDVKWRGYVSPQPRALQTAHALNIPVEWQNERRIRERSKGALERVVLTAQNYADIMAQAKACVDNPHLAPPNGESVAERLEEFEGFLQEMDERHPNEGLVLSTHGEMMRIMELAIERQPLSRWHEYQFPVPNCLMCAYSRVNPQTGELTDRFSWKLRFCTRDAREPYFRWQSIDA